MQATGQFPQCALPNQAIDTFGGSFGLCNQKWRKLSGNSFHKKKVCAIGTLLSELNRTEGRTETFG
jgi:hypothetical protein